MADNLMLRKESGWMAVCTMPDVCKTPPCIPVPYPVVAFLNDSEKTEIFKYGLNDSKALFDAYGNKFITYVE